MSTSPGRGPFVMIAVGSRGDVQPLAALARGLVRRGVPLRFLSHPEFRELAYGLDFHALPGADIRAIMERMTGAAARHGGRVDLFREFLRAADLLAAGTRELHEACRAVIRDARAYTVSPQLLGMAASLSEAGAPPFVCTALQPIDPTRAFPSPFLAARGLGPLNRLSHFLPAGLLWPRVRRAFNEWRIRDLGLPPAGWKATARWLTRPGLRLYGFSRHVVPPPADWPADRVVCGYWRDPGSAEGTLPPELERFLAAGEPPLGITFGSMLEEDPRGGLEIVIQALKVSGIRAVLLRGWGEWGLPDLPENVHICDPVSHDLLFPRLSAVVHHGGAGTTAAVLRHGLPSLVVPFALDQAFWGWRVHALGAGPKPLPRAALEVDRFRQRLEELHSSGSVGHPAQDLARRIQDENGLDAAMDPLASLRP